MENKSTFGTEVLKELEAEATATRKCLEQIPENLFDWKPHEKSMNLGYLSLLVAEIPKWIQVMVEESEIDFAAFEHFQPKNTAELVAHFDENLEAARRALKNVSDETLDEPFHLKNQGQIVFTAPKEEHFGSTVNHLVHSSRTIDGFYAAQRYSRAFHLRTVGRRPGKLLKVLSPAFRRHLRQ